MLVEKKYAKERHKIRKLNQGPIRVMNNIY
jgi:hypothetical protein